MTSERAGGVVTGRSRINSMDDRGDAADTCRDRGWDVGTRLVGDEGYGPTIIEITAIGQRGILAKRLAHNGRAVGQREGPWVLWCRPWHEHKGVVPAPYPAGALVVATVPDVVDHEPGTIVSGPDDFGLYRIHLIAMGKWITTDKFEEITGD